MPHSSSWRSEHGAQAKESATDCGSCHERSDCLTCHKASPLPSHTGDWRSDHSAQAKDDKALCSLCHSTSNGCKDCHGVSMPHPDDWIMEGHQPVAGFGSDSLCWKCHEESTCEMCHNVDEERAAEEDKEPNHMVGYLWAQFGTLEGQVKRHPVPLKVRRVGARHERGDLRGADGYGAGRASSARNGFHALGVGAARCAVVGEFEA